MAQYKVPQDVEADDKLLGPFSFRQFVYLLIAAGLIAAAVGLFQLFPLLGVIPIPFALFLLILALPLKKDQPMETYLAALVSYYLKPRSRKWMPGQKESTILITAPKIVEETRTRDISEEEATHRLSFLADIVDTGGYAIKGASASPMREDLVAEANATPDMFENYQSQVLNRVIDQDKMSRHSTAVQEMQEAIARNKRNDFIPDEDERVSGEKVITRSEGGIASSIADELTNALNEPVAGQSTAPLQPSSIPSDGSEVLLRKPTVRGALRGNAVLKPDIDLENSDVVVKPGLIDKPKKEDEKNVPTKPVSNSIIELANNKDFSVATIAKEANRINRKEKGEVYISLH